MRGDVVLRARCLMPEKLLDRALRQGARFERVRLIDSRTLLLECDATSAGILDGLCRRFSIPCQVTRLRGRSALARFSRRRGTLAVGIIAALALCWLFLGRVWFIDVALTGNAAALGDAQALSRALSEAGVRPGMALDADTQDLTQALRSTAGSYSYLALHRQGVRLVLEAAPESPAPAVYDVEAARDLVSDRDGIVIRAIARSGELCVKPGDVVRRGQLLIRGEEQADKENTRPIAALGEVVLRCWYTGTARLPLAREVERYTGRSATRTELTALGLRFEIARGEEYPSQRVTRSLSPIGGLFIPVQVESRTCRETQVTREAVDRGLLKARLRALALADASRVLEKEGPRDYELANSWVDYAREGDMLLARGVYEIYTDAAVTREVLQGG